MLFSKASVASHLLNLAKFLFYIVHAYLEAFYRFFVPPQMRSLKGEIILVTGSANGIGKQLCYQLAESKVTLVMWDCDTVANEQLAEDLKRKGVRAYPFHVDISDKKQVKLAANKVREQIGDVTILINNAGIAPISEFMRTTAETVEKTFQVNVISHFYIIQEFLPRMVENHHGHIATVCSIGGLRPLAGSVPYHGTKYAVHGYVESLKLQLAMLNCHGIRFTTIYPYFVDTNLTKDIKYSQRGSKLFQAFLPFMKPQVVAEKLIEGIRRNYEHVYCPGILPKLLALDNLLPLKLQRDLRLNFEKNFDLSAAFCSSSFRIAPQKLHCVEDFTNL